MFSLLNILSIIIHNVRMYSLNILLQIKSEESHLKYKERIFITRHKEVVSPFIYLDK